MAIRQGARDNEIDEDFDDGYGKPVVPKKGNSNAARNAMASSAGSGGGVGDIALAGGLATANPYVIAAGAGLKYLSAQREAKEKRAELEAQMKLKRLNAQRDAISNLIGVSQGLKL